MLENKTALIMQSVKSQELNGKSGTSESNRFADELQFTKAVILVHKTRT